jgi:hypothetical protein
MKLWGSMKQQAGKLAFEAEKAVRVKREESAISSLKAQVEAQSTALGKTVLNLAREGAIHHTQVEPFVQQVAELEEQITSLEAKIALIKAEEYTGDIPAEGATPPEPVPPPTIPAESVPPSPPVPPVTSSEESAAADEVSDATPTDE